MRGLSSTFGERFFVESSFEKWDIHKVCPHFPKLDSTKNLSPKVLDKPRGTALNLSHFVYFKLFRSPKPEDTFVQCCHYYTTVIRGFARSFTKVLY